MVTARTNRSNVPTALDLRTASHSAVTVRGCESSERITAPDAEQGLLCRDVLGWEDHRSNTSQVSNR